MEDVEKELGKLVLSNLEMLEKSYDFLAKMDELFCEKIESKFKFWDENFKKNSWWPKSLGKKQDEEAIWFTWGKKYDYKKYNIDTGYYLLSDFTGLAKYKDGESAEVGVYFGFTQRYFNLTDKTAKQFMQEQFENHPELKKAGFQYVGESREECKIFFPVRFELQQLIEEYPDYEDQALQPFSDALGQIENYQAVFDDIAKELMNYSKVQESLT